jgi:hypothetical protein
MEILNPPGFANAVLGQPPDWDEKKNGPCHGLPVKIMVDHFISLWKPTAEELFYLNQGQPIALGVYAKSHPPVFISVIATEKEVEGNA